ncbi:MAG: hypothetical protein EPO62_04430 [Candidatus Nitrosotenuis sp.]|nr:MAG: hypothetical protein EPO62_04430 [Candidatus Nitrosotenuis sp.]
MNSKAILGLISNISPRSRLAIFAVSIALLATCASTFGDATNIEFTKFVVRSQLSITFESQTPPNFYGYWFLYDRDNELVHYDRIIADENGKYKATSVILVEDSPRKVDDGIGYVEIYRYEDVAPGSGSILDSTKSIFRKKVDIELYKPQEKIHQVTVKNGIFTPQDLRIDLGDGIEFKVDCNDCYKLKWIASPFPSEINKPIPLQQTKFWMEGKYQIADIFDPKSNLSIAVIYPTVKNSDSPSNLPVQTNSPPTDHSITAKKQDNLFSILENKYKEESKNLKNQILKLKREVLDLKKKNNELGEMVKKYNVKGR